jgi:hypothetical protein
MKPGKERLGANMCSFVIMISNVAMASHVMIATARWRLAGSFMLS